MSKRIITISREFGSGGRSIGKAVAKELGIAYYDKDIVKAVAQKTGFDLEYIEENGEYAPGKSKLSYAFSAVGGGEVMNGMTAFDYVWSVQRKIILEIAESEPCVIVGRCADYILKERDDVLNVFVHADLDYRADRVVRLYGQSEKLPDKRLIEKDKRRSVNYNHYTDEVWGMSQNYDISLNSGNIGQERCVEIIVGIARTN